jgi:hypothetical protein
MSVFKYSELCDLAEVPRKLYGQYASHLALDLTQDEFEQAFIKKDHVPTLKEARRLAGDIGGVSFQTRIHVPPCENLKYIDRSVVGSGTGQPYLSSMVTFSGYPHVIVPRYVNQGMLLDECPPEIFEKITHWSNESFEIILAAAQCSLAITKLYGLCETDRQMACLLPVLPFIMKTYAGTENAMSRRADRLLKRTTVPSLPSISRAAKERLREVSTRVSMFSLLAGTAAPEHRSGMVRLQALALSEPVGSVF